MLSFKAINKKDYIEINEHFNLRKNNDKFYTLNKQGRIIDIIEDYIEFVYIQNNIIHCFKDYKWYSYLINKDDVKLVISSKYLVIKFPNLVAEYDVGRFRLYNSNYNVESGISTNKILFNGDDFAINDGLLVMKDLHSNRYIKYQLKSDIFTEGIIKSNNLIKTKKLKIYLDNIGGIEILESKNDKKIYKCNKYYKVLTYLYVLKVKEKYIVLDINKNIIIFTGHNIDTNPHNKYVTLENTFSKEILYITGKDDIKIFDKFDFINNKDKFKQSFKQSLYLDK